MVHANPTIDWSLIGKSIEHFSSLGYRYLEVPWVASTETLRVTFPGKTDDFKVSIGHLVGSAEQSFIDMVLRGELGPGSYCACTPCFREEPRIDQFHRYYFVKVELIHISVTDDPGEKILNTMIEDCRDWFSRNTSRPVRVEETDIGFDLVSSGIELGSYGERSHGDIKWVYGTGLAEPRFSTVRDMPK